MTLVSGVDPVFDDFVINYDESFANSVGTVSVDLVVSFKDYPDNENKIYETFDFTI